MKEDIHQANLDYLHRLAVSRACKLWSAGPACHSAEYEPAQSASALGAVVINATACTESGKSSELERTNETKKKSHKKMKIWFQRTPLAHAEAKSGVHPHGPARPTAARAPAPST